MREGDNGDEITGLICLFFPVLLYGMLFPSSHSQVFTFDVVKPDVSVLQLVLLDEDVGDDQILGYSTVPVTAIRPGIRFMPLFDETGSNGGDYEYSFICVRVAVELL